MILVGHDRRLIEATAEPAAADGGAARVEPFEGELDDYRKFLLTGDNAPTRRIGAGPRPTKEEHKAQRRRKSGQQLKPLKERIQSGEIADRHP